MADETKYTSQFDGSQIDALLNKVGLMPAYPIEMSKHEGENDWGYIKYSLFGSPATSGIAILWGYFNLDQTTGFYRRIPEAETTGGKYSKQIHLEPPFKISNTVIVGDADNLNFVCNGAGSYADKRVTFRLFRHDGIQENASIYVRVVVFGLWNSET